MNRIGKLLVGAALATGVTLGAPGIAWADDQLIDARPCEGGSGVEVYANGSWYYVCVYK